MKRLDIAKSILGESLYESLMKAIVKQDTHSVVDITELHDALKIVPKSLLAFVMQATKDMDKESAREIKLPWEQNTMMLINKQTDDAYKGHIVRDGLVVHEFALCSIPQLAAHLLSFSEMYDQVPGSEATELADNPQEESTSDADIWEHLRVLDSKINALMMLVANQSPIVKSEPIAIEKAEVNKFAKFCKSLTSLKKVGLMPKMPSPPKPGVKVGGSQGITKEGMHGPKTAASDTNTHPYTQLKDPNMKVPQHNADKVKQPKQPKVFGNTPTAQKSEKEVTFKKSELEGQCVNCGLTAKHCACFQALSAPEIKKSENDRVTLRFKNDWDEEAITALWQSLKKSRRG